MADFDKRLKAIDQAIGRYYASHNAADYFNGDGKGKFYVFCTNNGFDEEDEFNIEMKQSPDESMIVDFYKDEDENATFPGIKSDDNINEQIWAIIKQRVNNPNSNDDIVGITFDPSTFKISEEELENIKQLYKQQCPAEFIKPIINDSATFHYMAIGHKNGYDYIQNLVDEYQREKVRQYAKNGKTDYTISKWVNDRKHFKNLQNIKPPIMIDNESKNLSDDVQAAVKGFQSRICPALMFTQDSVITDSLEHIATWICNAARFVNQQAQKSEHCPFQCDFCIAFAGIIEQKGDDDGDDDDDDDDDEEEEEKDGADGNDAVSIGDIEEKLKNNQLKYYTKPVSVDEAEKGRFLGITFNEFCEQKPKTKSCQFRRFVSFIDRRGDKEKVTIYDPPKDSNDVYKDALSTRFLSSSVICLVPNMNYKESPLMTDDDSDKKEQSSKSDKIGVKTNCNLLTISFHIKEVDAIKAYLFVHGQYIRFMAEDLMNLLPIFFEQTEQNKAFLKGERIKDLIKEIRTYIKDKYFNAFVAKHCN